MTAIDTLIRKHFLAGTVTSAISVSYHTETVVAKHFLKRDEQGIGNCCCCQSLVYNYGY